MLFPVIPGERRSQSLDGQKVLRSHCFKEAFAKSIVHPSPFPDHISRASRIVMPFADTKERVFQKKTVALPHRSQIGGGLVFRLAVQAGTRYSETGTLANNTDPGMTRTNRGLPAEGRLSLGHPKKKPVPRSTVRFLCEGSGFILSLSLLPPDFPGKDTGCRFF